MTKNIRSIIIDDELNNISLLQKMLEKHCPQINVIQSESNAQLGLDCITSLQPDLVFMDIEMPSLNGFEVLKKLEPISFEVIFVTAHSEFAIEAFESNAVGYITKPIQKDKLISAVLHAQERIEQKVIATNLFSILQANMSSSSNNKIPLSTMNGLVFIEQDDIMYCESNGNYTHFQTVDGKKIVVSRQLGEYEKLLPESYFVRIHDKYIIHLKFMTEYIKGRGGEVKLNNSILLPVSANRKHDLLDRFERWLRH